MTVERLRVVARDGAPNHINDTKRRFLENQIVCVDAPNPEE